jgi:hypothetical protein
MTLKFLALQGAPYIYDISRLRVNFTSRLAATRKAALHVNITPFPNPLFILNDHLQVSYEKLRNIYIIKKA